MKALMVAVEDSQALPSQVAAAVLLARRFESYVEGYCVVPSFSDFVGGMIGSEFGSSVPAHWIEEVAQEWERRRDALEHQFAQLLTQGGISIRGPDAERHMPFAAWRSEVGDIVQAVGRHGRSFDLVIISQPLAEATSFGSDAIESAVFESGRPVLVTPREVPATIGKCVLIAWNGSREASRAVLGALPLISEAEEIAILTVSDGALLGPSAEELQEYLALHGIVSGVLTRPDEGGETTEVILDGVARHRADLLVKGAYTHAQVRQMIFGGVTRDILAQAKVPVLMAH